MITLKLSELTHFPISEEHQNLLDNIPTRQYTDWIDLPNDPDQVIESINQFVKDREGSWDRILALGMGGSALGIVTLQKAFFPFDDRLTVVDNLDANTIHHLLETIDPERTLVMIISKSGGTLETMTNYYVFKKHFSPEQYQKNFIAITDPKDGFLREIADRDKLSNFPIPPMVGGRFSVLTALGLLPLALLGGSPEELLKGAKNMLDQCQEKSENNPALQLALASYFLSLNPQNPQAPQTLKAPKNITTLISYSDQLYSLGLWYQQLLAESIGKSREVGLTPLALRGASDQHSVLQLLQDGPDDKLNIFLDLLKTSKDVTIEDSENYPTILNGKSMHEILRAECHGTEQALKEDGRPTIMIEVSEVSEETLGALFMLFQMQIALLGELYEIDAFNQPGVEKSKKIVKAALA